MKIHWVGSEGNAGVEVRSIEGRVIAALNADMLDQHIRAGLISSSVLIDRSHGAEHRLARLLALLACAQACRHGLTCLALDCPLHPAGKKSIQAPPDTAVMPLGKVL